MTALLPPSTAPVCWWDDGRRCGRRDDSAGDWHQCVFCPPGRDGGVTIDKLPGGGLSIRLLVGGIAFGHTDEVSGIWVTPGADDKVFHLDPAPVDACKSLEENELGGWDDEPGQ
jgi:hypothetical protein